MEGSTFASWLYRIAHNQVVDPAAARRPQVDLDPLAGFLVADTGDPTLTPRPLLRGQLRVALAPDRVAGSGDRAQVRRRPRNGEVARVLDRTEGAIKALQHSALQNLHKSLHDLRVDDGAPPTRLGTRRGKMAADPPAGDPS